MSHFELSLGSSTFQLLSVPCVCVCAQARAAYIIVFYTYDVVGGGTVSTRLASGAVVKKKSVVSYDIPPTQRSNSSYYPVLGCCWVGIRV